MVDELKIIADVLSQVSSGALTGIIVYLILDFLKLPFIFGIIGITLTKVIKLFTNRKMNVVEIEEEKE